MIQVKKLVKNFGLHPVLRGLDLHVQRGEFLTLLGPNGAGKTTLLNILGFLEPPTSGKILFRSRPVRFIGAELQQLRRSAVLVD